LTPAFELKYQPEIDGLRAVSVMLVVLYHAGLPITGGYVGVDVFFVISGFLITALIAKEINNGTFSLAKFWERRIRRIFPASLVTMLVVLILGTLIMVPRDLEKLGQSSIAQAAMLSNVYFWRDVDYFAGSAETKPLLHTWSLAVEEQFYLFYPILLVCLSYYRRIQFGLLLGLSLISFVLSVIFVAYRPQAAFYLLPFRAWELLLGGLIALRPIYISSKTARELLAATGIVLILLGAVLFDAATPFPGIAAMLPCLGAAAFITGNLFDKTSSGRILSWQPIVFVGLISYSLYLWHWPIMAFMRYLYIPFTLTNSILAIAASLILATLSWKFVEGPFRKSHKSSPKKSWIPQLQTRGVIVSGVLSLIVMAGLGFSVIWFKGLPGRYSEQMLLLVDDATWNGSQFAATKQDLTSSQFKSVGLNKDQIDFVVWGDSHALMYFEVIDELAIRHRLCGHFIGVAGNPPIPNVWRGRSREQGENAAKVLEYVKHSGIQNVVLIARWSLYTEGYSESELHFEEKGQRLEDGLIRDANSPSDQSIDDARRAFKAHFAALLHQLYEQQIRVWVVQQVPEQQSPIAMPWLFQNQGFPTQSLLGTTRELDGDRQAFFKQVVSELTSTNATLLETSDCCFSDEGKPILTADGRASYRDNDHLSRFGAKH
jgi:peptidoglycan/LPS O-acetylase OafA/YrhL